MGNSQSQTGKGQEKTGVFKKELESISHIIGNIVSEKDTFRNKNYNFLSEDVCKQHYILLQNELQKHLKVDLQSLGASLYIIPKSDEDKLSKYNITKPELCQMISSHYVRILYILCLIKHVYNLERFGDMSIAGIVFRNIEIVDDMMKINFCQTPQKDPRKDFSHNTQIDLGMVEGINFFTEYILDREEANSFIKMMRYIFSRKRKEFSEYICLLSARNKVTKKEFKEFEKSFSEGYTCSPQKGGSGIIDKNVEIVPENPILSSNLCFSASNPIRLKINTKEGKKVLDKYNLMKKNYQANINEINKLLNMITTKEAGNYILRDIKKEHLDEIISEVKTRVKQFYIQSILDFHSVLDIAKTVPHLK